MKLETKKILEQKRRWRVRRKVKGTAERPRLAVCFSNKHVYAQCIDDKAGKTLAALCTTGKELKARRFSLNVAGAKLVGENSARSSRLLASRRSFSTGARARYHGCVKTFADAVRSAGINF